MKIAEIKFIFEYNTWANHLILSTAEQVTPEQVKQPNKFSYGSLFGTLVHTMDAEYSWRLLVDQGIFAEELKPEQFADLAAIRAHWNAEEAAMAEYLNRLSDDDMERIISYQVEEGTRNRVLWHCLYHVVNHGMQHRSECAVMLTDFGQSPGNLDFTRFLNERA